MECPSWLGSHLHGRGSSVRGGVGTFQEHSAGDRNCRWPLQSGLACGKKNGEGRLVSSRQVVIIAAASLSAI